MVPLIFCEHKVQIYKQEKQKWWKYESDTNKKETKWVFNYKQLSKELCKFIACKVHRI